MSSSNAAIQFDDVWKRYSKDAIFHRSIREDIVNLFRPDADKAHLGDNEFWALQRVSFSVANGETLALFGPNGAGKSTILKLISRITYPTSGIVSVNGKIAPLIEIGAGFHPDLSGRENIFVNGSVLGMRIQEIRHHLDSIVAFAEIGDFIDMPVKKYSSGMYLRLAFAIAIHSNADTFLIDEILTVGDEYFQLKCLEKIFEMKRQGKTMLIVTHDRALMLKVADRILTLEKGVITTDQIPEGHAS